jgi:hypothetical protein
LHDRFSGEAADDVADDADLVDSQFALNVETVTLAGRREPVRLSGVASGSSKPLTRQMIDSY